MTNKDSKQLVETLLSTYDINKFSSSGERLAYERGVLTGILALLICNHTYTAMDIKKLIDNRSQR
jgi:hypothetical protein